MEQATRSLAYVRTLTGVYTNTRRRRLTPVILTSHSRLGEASKKDRYAKTTSTTQSYLGVI